MEHPASKHWRAFIRKIKEGKVSASAILILAFCVFAFALPWHFEIPQNHASLPEIHAASGTLALVTMPDQSIAPTLALIRHAAKSIDLVMYEFKDRAIGDALIGATKRGVAVRVIVNQGYYGQEEPANEPAYAYLQSHRIAIQYAPASFALTHQQTMVVDGNEAFIMTFNFVPAYYAKSRDFGIIDTDMKDVQAIENVFDADFQNKKIAPDDGDDLVWSPGSEKDMLMLIASANKSLEIYNEEMADDKVSQALIDAAARGVDVQVIMTYASNEASVFTQLKNGGVHIRTYQGKKSLYIHAKMIIADDDYGWLGSENFSSGSLEKNRELGIFISDQTILASLSKTFTGDWGGGKEY